MEAAIEIGKEIAAVAATKGTGAEVAAVGVGVEAGARAEAGAGAGVITDGRGERRAGTEDSLARGGTRE